MNCSDRLRQEVAVSNPKSKDDAIEMIHRGLDKVYFKIALNCSVPLFWYPRNQTGVTHSGTAFFVDAGKGPFAITARHVIEALRQDREKQELICQVGPLAIDPIERLIEENEKCDIATFSMSEQEISKTEKVVHTPPHSWPPKPPDEGKGVFFGGFRKSDRQESVQRIIWGFAGVLGVANIRDNHMSVQFERQFVVQDGNLPCPAVGEPWGGVSGGPVFAVVGGNC